MALYSNRSIVLRLIQKATEEHPDWLLGKKALQKSLYFFNLNHDYFSFKWDDFGPMSGEIQQIVHDLEASGRIKIKPSKTKKPDIFIKNIKYVSKEPELYVPQNIHDGLDAVMEFVAGQNSRKLELFASVHFWAIRNDDNDMAEYVYQKLEELKPEAGFTKTDVEDAIKELRKNKILK